MLLGGSTYPYDLSKLSAADRAFYEMTVARRDLQAVAAFPRAFYGQQVKVCGHLYWQQQRFWIISDGGPSYPDGGTAIQAKNCTKIALDLDENGCVRGLMRRIDTLEDKTVTQSVAATGANPEYIIIQGCSLREELPN